MMLWHYLKGNRKGKEAHLLEKEAMKDPFLADALEGFDSMSGNHTARIGRLRKAIRKKSARRINYLKVWSASACILLIAGAAGYFLLRQQGQPGRALFAYEEMEENIPPLSPPTVLAMPEDEETVKQPPSDETPTEQIIVSVDNVVEMPKSPPELKTKPEQLALETEATSTEKIIIRGSAHIPDSIQQETALASRSAKQLLPDTSAGISAIKADTAEARDGDAAMETGVSGQNKDKDPVPVIGQKAFANYLKKNLKRPEDDDCRGVKGKVTVGFYVNGQGRPYNITVRKGLCETADKEAVRLIDKGPDWVYGGKEVTVDIKF